MAMFNSKMLVYQRVIYSINPRIFGFAEAKDWILVDLSGKTAEFSATRAIQATNLWMLIKVIKVAQSEISHDLHHLNET